MPLDPKITKNGIDLNTVDVSTMALVDKEGLLDDLTKRLKKEIKDSVASAVSSVHDEIADIVTTVQVNTTVKSGSGQQGPAAGGSQQYPQTPQQPSSSAGSQPSSGGGGWKSSQNQRPSSAPRAPRQPSNDELFARRRQSQLNSANVSDKITAQQKKQEKDQHAEYLKQNAYSAKGKDYAERIDEIASSYQTKDRKELEDAVKDLKDIQEGVKFTTSGKDKKLLTDATEKLQKELAIESKKREGMFGNIGKFLSKENIDATSIITGVLGNSPMAGLMTKGALEIFKHYKEKAQKKKADQFKVGDVREKLPRPNDPDITGGKWDEKNDKIFRTLSALKNDEDIYTALEDAHNNGNITDETYASLKPRLLPPGYQPPIINTQQGTSPTQVTNSDTQHGPPLGEPQQGPQAVPQRPLTPLQQLEANAAQAMRRDKEGNAMPPRKSLDEHLAEADAWKTQMFGPHRVGNAKTELQAAEEELEKLKKNPPASNPEDEEIYGNPLENAQGKVDSLRRQHGRMEKVWGKQKPIESNVLTMPLQAQAPEQMARAAQPQRVATAESEELNLHPLQPELVRPPDTNQPDNVVSILKGMKKTEDAESKNLEVFNFRNRKNRLNPFLILEKHSTDQLNELKAIKTLLEKQIEQADLQADAATRMNGDHGGHDGGVDGGGGAGGLASLIKKGGKGGGEAGGGGWKGKIAEYLVEAYGAGSMAKGLWNKGKGAVNVMKGSVKGWKDLFTGGGKVAEAGGESSWAGKAGKFLGEKAKTVKDAFRGGSKVAEAGEAGGWLGKIGGMAKKIPGVAKLGGAGKLLGQGATIVELIMAGVNAHEGYNHAAEYMGKRDDEIEIGDRIGAAASNVLGHMGGGAIDQIGSLFGQKWNATERFRDSWITAGQNIKKHTGPKVIEATNTNTSKKLTDRIQKIMKMTPSLDEASARRQAMKELMIEKNTAAPATSPPTTPTPATPNTPPNTPPPPTPISDNKGNSVAAALNASTPEKVGGSSITGLPGKTEGGGRPDSSQKTLSDKGLEFIKKNEGFADGKEYWDRQGYSIGYGHLQTEEERKKYKGQITEAQASELLKKDTEKTASFINTKVKVPLTQNQFDALVDFGHSGLGYLSNIIETLNTGDYEGATKRMQLYVKAANKEGKLEELSGLVTRRKEEAAMFMDGENAQTAKATSKIAPTSPISPTQTSAATPDTNPGVRLTQASIEQRNLERNANATSTPPANVNVVNAPQTNKTSTTVVQDVKPQNTESTYQRTMNSQYMSV